MSKTIHIVGWQDDWAWTARTLQQSQPGNTVSLTSRIQEALLSNQIRSRRLSHYFFDTRWEEINSEALEVFANWEADFLEGWSNLLVSEINQDYILGRALLRLIELEKTTHLVFWFKSLDFDNLQEYSFLLDVTRKLKIDCEQI